MKVILFCAILALALFGQSMACSSADGCYGASRQLLSGGKFFPSTAVVLMIVLPFVLVIVGIVITVTCYCCACCLAIRGAHRVHEVEMITAAPVVISHGSTPLTRVDGYYVGAPRQDIYLASPMIVAAPMPPMVAPAPQHAPPVYVPLVVEEDSFY